MPLMKPAPKGSRLALLALGVASGQFAPDVWPAIPEAPASAAVLAAVGSNAQPAGISMLQVPQVSLPQAWPQQATASVLQALPVAQPSQPFLAQQPPAVALPQMFVKPATSAVQELMHPPALPDHDDLRPQGECPCKDEAAEVEEEVAPDACRLSHVAIRQDHAGPAGGRFGLNEAFATYGGSSMTEAQKHTVKMVNVSQTPFLCLDDRINEPTLATPGGDLGEFILGLATYLFERDPNWGASRPSQEVVTKLLQKFLMEAPAGRPMVLCTDDRAIEHLEAELPAENLDLASPPEQLIKAGLLQKLTEVENEGDGHLRLMLKQPEWFQLSPYLVPMVLKAFYSTLWEQNQNKNSPLYNSGKLGLKVLVGQSDPQGFLEVSSGQLCHNAGMAPEMTPKTAARQVLISHLDAVSLRREELASFFARVANATPRKISKEKLAKRLDRHGWLALETTGSRIASNLPFFSLSYS